VRRSPLLSIRAFSILVVLVLALATGAPRPAAADDDPGSERVRDPRIVGGTEAPPGAWPSQVALLQRSVPNAYDAQFCGGTVIAASWVLTAAHCTVDPFDGSNASPSTIDVLTGRSDLNGTGGQRLHVVEIVRHSGWNFQNMRNDIALLRLDSPTNAPAQGLIQQGQYELWDPGSTATATGWGATAGNGGTFPARLRQVTVPMVSDNDCAASYPVGAPAGTFHGGTMVCAGVLPGGGRDTCQGDSGGPLVVPRPGGGWLQVGITSWGEGCAEPNRPGVYTRLAVYSPWVAQHIRYGPFGSSTEFVNHQYADILGRNPTDAERNALVSRLDGGLAPERAIEELVRSDASLNSAGAIVRFYYGFFAGRDPDTGGLLYWLDQNRNGVSLGTIASVFSQSTEFQNQYGPLTDGQFVDLVYQNVLHRAPDAGGRAYWLDQLNRGLPRWALMQLFTESTEHRDVTRARVDRTILHTALLREAPTKAWLDLTLGVPLDGLARTLFLGTGYARRF
jgi:secreted trypsin-like serine protease